MEDIKKGVAGLPGHGDPAAQENLAVKELIRLLQFMRHYKSLDPENLFRSPIERAIFNSVYLSMRRACVYLTAREEHLESLLLEVEEKPLYTNEELLERTNFSEAEKAAALKMMKK